MKEPFTTFVWGMIAGVLLSSALVVIVGNLSLERMAHQFALSIVRQQQELSRAQIYQPCSYAPKPTK